jgi:hypothetical protein
MNYTTFLNHIIQDNTTLVKKGLNSVKLNPAMYSNRAVVKASELGSNATLLLLLADSRIDPIVNDNDALMSAYKNNQERAFAILIGNERVVSSLTSDWVKQNIKKENFQKIALNGISIYNF